MQSNLITHNVNSAHVMPMWSTRVVNPNDIMHCTCMFRHPYIILMHHIMLIGLACVHADHQLLKITASHFQVIITQNANENMLIMLLIA